MKNYILLLSILLVWASCTLEAQAQTKKKTDLSKLNISSLTLSTKAARQLADWPNSVCQVDQRGRLRPVKGYYIRFDTRQKKLFLTGIKDKKALDTMDGAKDLGNGMIFRCIGGCANCKPDDQPGGFCPGCFPEKGSCEGELILPWEEVAEFQTPDGNYGRSDINPR
jgi:hypothetical protein